MVLEAEQPEQLPVDVDDGGAALPGACIERRTSSASRSTPTVRPASRAWGSAGPRAILGAGRSSRTSVPSSGSPTRPVGVSSTMWTWVLAKTVRTSSTVADPSSTMGDRSITSATSEVMQRR